MAIAALAVAIAIMFVAGLIWKGKSLEGGLTYFSWLLTCGATGILPVYGLVAIAGALHARRLGSGNVLDLVIAPALALVVVAAAEVTEFYDQPSPFKYAPYVMLAWMALGVIVRIATRDRVAPVEQRDPLAPELAT